MLSSHPEFLTNSQHTLPDGRQLALSCSGPADAADVLVCLPGLLETRRTFDPVLQSRPAGLRCISIDYCGRGDSDPLAGDLGYSMARYRADLKDFLAREIPAGTRLHLLGTSMGGILAFYLIAEKQHDVRSLLLNDIGLSLHWTALMDLARQMKVASHATDMSSLAQSLKVTPGVLSAVQFPTHFDLPYRRSLRGMEFSQLVAGYTGVVRLVRGQSSTVCLPAQVKQLHRQHPDARVLDVAHASHPVPWDRAVCEFLLQDLLAVQNHATSAPTPANTRASIWRWLQSPFTRQRNRL